jgi:hypothetical protein
MVGGSAGARGLLLLAGTCAITPSAHASAWAIAEGVQQWFATVSRETGDFGETWRADDFVEYGLGDGWAINGKIESEIRIADIYDDRSGYRLGVMKAFPLGDRASFSVQASLIGGESTAGAECVGGGHEARAAIGTSFSLWGREGFVNVEAGHSQRGDCGRSLAEFALGLEFASGWDMTLKAWNEGGGQNGSTKAEFMISHDFGLLAVGAGWREEISGNFDERGWILSASARF